MIDASNCSLCSAGTYQSGLAMRFAINCTVCSAGKYQTGLGIAQEQDCKNLTALMPYIQISFSVNIRTELFLVLDDKYLTLIADLIEVPTYQVWVASVNELLPNSSLSVQIKGAVSQENCSLAVLNVNEVTIQQRETLEELPLTSNHEILVFNCAELVKAKVLPPNLKQQAVATTVVVSSVVAVVVSSAVATSVAASVAGSIASSGPPGGASIFQLINAAQFLNIFGALVGKAKSSGIPSRRLLTPENSSDSTTKSGLEFSLDFASSDEDSDASVFRRVEFAIAYLINMDVYL